MKNKLTETEKQVILDFLEELSKAMGNSGCNDLKLPKTEESLHLIKEAWEFEISDKKELEEWIDNANKQFKNKEKYLITTDFVILGYLANKLKQIL